MRDQKHHAGCVTAEAIDTYVRVTVRSIGGPDAPDTVRVTRREVPSAMQVAELVRDIRGYWPDNAVLQACGMAAKDARANREQCMVLE